MSGLLYSERLLLEQAKALASRADLTAEDDLAAEMRDLADGVVTFIDRVERQRARHEQVEKELRDLLDVIHKGYHDSEVSYDICEKVAEVAKRLGLFPLPAPPV